jgi:hypothetical protein
MLKKEAYRQAEEIRKCINSITDEWSDNEGVSFQYIAYLIGIMSVHTDCLLDILEED